MAKKKVKKAKKKATPVAGVPISVVTIVTPDTPVFYSNHAEVSHSKYEYAVTFTRVQHKFTTEEITTLQADPRLRVDAQVQVLIPPRLVDGLIKALQVQKQKYETGVGKPDEPAEEAVAPARESAAVPAAGANIARPMEGTNEQ